MTMRMMLPTWWTTTTQFFCQKNLPIIAEFNRWFPTISVNKLYFYWILKDSNSWFLKKRLIFGKNLVKIDFNVTEERGRIMKTAIHDPSNVVFVSTTDGAGIATVLILDKHCNWAIRGHFSTRIIFTLVMVFIFISLGCSI